MMDAVSTNVTAALSAVIVQGSVLLLVVGAAVFALRAASAALRHWLWTLGLAAVLVLPLLAALLPARHSRTPAAIELPVVGWHLVPAAPAPAGESAEAPAAVDATASPAAPRHRLPLAAVPAIWAAGLALMAARYLRGGAQLAVRARRAHELEPPDRALVDQICAALGLRADVAVRLGDEPCSPQAWGWRRPLILLPPQWGEWDDGQRRAVLVHELAHVRRRDCWSQTFAHLACCLYWFQPLVWLAAARMRSERERACDDVVLASGARPSAYADQLLSIASTLGRTGRPAFGEVPMARSSQLSGRLLAILDPRARRRPLGRASGAAALAAVAACAVALASFATDPTASRAAPATASTNVSVDDFARAWRGVADEMLAAAQARDGKRFAACYARQAHLMAQGVPTIHGRDAIADIVPKMWATGVSDIDLNDLEFYRVGERFCVVGNLTFLDDGGQPFATARFMSIYQYEDGRWRILRDIANS